MSGKIFLNYRRGDDAGTVGRLFDRLEQAFGEDAVFMDVAGQIKAGDDYVEVLRAQVDQCGVLLAAIGPRWLTIVDENGRRRLEDPDDWVRVEIASALKAGIVKRVIPVLVPGGEMPRAEDLPEDLKSFARKQAVRVSLEQFKSDAQGLVTQITGVLADLEKQAAASAAERAATKAAEEQREAEQAEKQARVAARASAERSAGMSAEDVRKAEEIANWDFIKETTDRDELRDHLARFPSGATCRYARARLANLTFRDLSADSPIEELTDFLETFPRVEQTSTVTGWFAAADAKAREEAELAGRRARETSAWLAVATGTDVAAIRTFLQDWPYSTYTVHAMARIVEIEAKQRAEERERQGRELAEKQARQWAYDSIPAMRTLKGHTDRVSCVAIAPDANIALSGSSDNTVKMWDLSSGQVLRTFFGEMGGVDTVTIARDGKTALSAGGGHTLKLWDLTAGQKLRTFVGHSKRIMSVSIAADGRTALSGSEDTTLKLWDVASGKELRTFAGHTAKIIWVAFASDGRTGFSGSADNSLRLWDLASGKELRNYNAGPSLAAVTIATDQRTALSGSRDNVFKFLDLTSGEVLRTFTDNTGVSSVAIAPDGRTAVSGNWDGRVKHWDLASGQMLHSFSHRQLVSSVAIAPDGRTAISAGADRTLKIWDLTC
ncbi:MAG: TIR domain-containing protein [Hyphomicrobium sp.]